MVWLTILTTGIALPTFGAWLTNEIPRKGDSPAEVEKKVRKIAISAILGIAVAGITYMATRPATTATFTRTIYGDLVKID